MWIVIENYTFFPLTTFRRNLREIELALILNLNNSFHFLIKSNERSEYSYIGFADFFFRKNLKMCIKVSNNYRCAFVHIDAFMSALRYICTF